MTNENMNDNYLGENLRRIRKLYERKQIDIAACIGISVRQYRKMENDEVPIKDRYLLSLATCYSITIDTLREFSASTLTARNKSTDNQLITPHPHNAQTNGTQLYPPPDTATEAYYKELLAAKEEVIRSQREFIAFLSNKRHAE